MSLKTKKKSRAEISKFDDLSERDSISIHVHKVETAEGDFALRKFKSSLRLSNEMLSSNITTHNQIYSENTRVISLPNPLLGGSNYMNVRFSLSVGDDSKLLHIQNRSCAIALQSSYELWKLRISNESQIDQEFLCDITRALDFLMNSSDGQNARSLVHFDLISIYVDFCHAIGISVPLIPSILQLLLYFMELIKQEQIKSSTDGILYNGCYSLLHLLLVQILPFIHDQQIIEITMESVEIFLHSGEVRLVDQLTEICTVDMTIRNEPVQSTVHVIHNSLTGFLNRSTPTSSSEKVLEKALREVLCDLKDNMDETISESLPGLSSVIEEASDRLSKQINSRFEYANQFENNSQGIHSLKEIIHSTIYNVWESENRWLHRAKLLGGSLVAFAFWKQRRSVLKSGRYLGKALTSPVREFASAFKPP
jgi:hypothetical protein